MRVLIDTNVALDVLLRRAPHYQESARILLLSEKHEVEGYISASAITDIYYVVRRTLKDKHTVTGLLKKLIEAVSVAAVVEENVHRALNLEWDDFEDAIQYTVGENLSADYIITRNPRDFADSIIPILTPEQFLRSLMK